MNSTQVRTKWRALSLVAIIALSLSPRPVLSSDAPSAIREGRELFEKRFVQGEASPSGGDGLGPMFNHVSCVACHLQGNIGGGGPIDVNVILLSAQLARPNQRPQQKTLVDSLRGLHNAFITADNKIVPSIILHRFGSNQRYTDARHFFAPSVPLDPTPAEREALQRELAEHPLPTAKTRPPITLVRPQRNTTALFGAGRIDEIPDSVFHSLAAAQAKEGEVSGRVPPVGPDKVGRFGWRGQMEHLHDFVLGACANELGLEVPGNPQPVDPFRPKYRPAGLDLTAEQCRTLTAFVAALPAPKMVAPLWSEHREIAVRGQKLFASVGCAACHVARIGPVEAIYSDLLLHDMGPALADPVLAAATLELVKQRPLVTDDDSPKGAVNTSIPRTAPPPQPSPSGNYYGGSGFQSLALSSAPSTVKIADAKAGMENEYRVQQTSLDREWRTPPLWGVADSAPYLHDGRAATILDAIALHGGEADKSMKQFFAASAGDRLAILTFLNCLKAP